MGCSSGALLLNGSYSPIGAPLSFLQAGSPFIVANLWVVGDFDIDRFANTILEAWFKESESVGCEHRPKFFGSFMGEARKACKFSYLTGASAVCYGVPTVIRRKAVW
ncbi:hypothetical protein LWI29_033774 [Acer saccharum]|uniref:Uncharacterized protein n=1 Tax=Acer saccharum TaxID=4024 RepID=A0AA39REX0_ACESA|nr:hypothetical protein LWI29_033774 [Acer saccharum]